MMTAQQYYQSVLTRDTRFDGRFLVAVRTTRIYCRPICRVKPPLQKNCTFFRYAAAAEAAGYRPCKRCRPELAPGSSAMDSSGNLARRAVQFINQGLLADHSLEDLAARLVVTDRQMRRVFHAEFGVSPVEFWQTQRLLLAKQLLTDSTMAVTTVAFASGFQSLRRFNALLKKRYRMTPTDLRKSHRGKAAKDSADFAFRLSYRPPFDWDGLLGFLSLRAVPGVESIVDGVYSRAIRVRHRDKDLIGHVQLKHCAEQRVLAVQLSDSLLPVCAAVLERLKNLFDLHADPLQINAALSSLTGVRPGLRVPGCCDSFELAVRAVLGQQITIAAATTLAGRFAAYFGEQLPMPVGALIHAFPTPERIARASIDEIGKLGITGRRSETLVALAIAMATGTLLLEPGHRVDETLEQLKKIPGIGDWTAQYIAMRALAWPDAFPHTDLGIRKALGDHRPDRILEIAERWRPWRAYAAMHCWTSSEPN